jgi:hypothetical protein
MLVFLESLPRKVNNILVAHSVKDAVTAKEDVVVVLCKAMSPNLDVRNYHFGVASKLLKFGFDVSYGS